MPCRNLRPATTQGQLLQRVVERQTDLCGIPTSRELRGHGLTPADLHSEAIETQRPRPVGLRMRLVAESVARLARAAARAQYRQGRSLRSRRRLNRRAAVMQSSRARRPTIERQLPTIVDLPKCLCHVYPPLTNDSMQGV
jgi:hypothetical protein